MDPKVVLVINKMIEKSHLISEVIKSSQNKDEYFFVFNKKHKWSVMYQENPPEDYLLFYYPTEASIDELANTPEPFLVFITYKASDFKAKEVDESFIELYNIVKAKVFNVDAILDDIINT